MSRVRFGGSLMLALSLAACAPSFAQRGRQALARGDYGLAIDQLGAATLEDPDDPALWRDLARAHMRAIEPQRALEAIDNAHALDPEDPENALVRGQARLAVEQRDGALEDARFVSKHGDSARGLQETAILLLRLHRADEAIAAAERAVTLSKDDPTAYANLAVLAVKVGRHDVAEQAFARGRRIHPDHIGLTEAHAAWLVTRGELARARDVYRELLATHPDPGLIHLALALLSHSMGDLAAARRHSEAAVEAVGRERADVHYTRVIVLRDSGELEAARDHLDRARRDFPGDEELAQLAKTMRLP